MKKHVEEFLNNQNEEIPVESKEEAKRYFRIMKEIYNSRMQEYIKELSKI
jgi:hypothetical protein